ncbi:hypothetical protein GCM10027435_10170 [Haloparvum alkalitolerans]|uniref:HVO_0416 family zinc finger protein n=1 Tax=Haloparvum TaxID=1820337 RepID=UPI00071E892C|nr:HVO_0416 family zinc finger protein [Haloparvum sedimenti]
MSSAPSTNDDELFDEFLADNGHETEIVRWERSYNKKQCPDCGALHDESAATCGVCGWDPAA